MAIVKDWDDPTEEIDTEKCPHCQGNSAITKKDGTKMTSKEYCIETNTCSATIDWEVVYHGKNS